MTPLNVKFCGLDVGLFLALCVTMVCVTGARISNAWYKSEKFPSLTDNCCSHQSFTLLEDIYHAIIVLVFWPLVSLLMLLGYVACRGFFFVRSLTKRIIGSIRKHQVIIGSSSELICYLSLFTFQNYLPQHWPLFPALRSVP